MRNTFIPALLLALIIALPAGASPLAGPADAPRHNVTVDTTDYVITEADFSPRVYVGARDTVAFDAISGYFNEHIGQIFGALQASGTSPSGPVSGLYWSWDMENMRADMAAVVPVASAPAVVDGYDVIELPAGKALVVEYTGPYEQMMSAHEAIGAYIEEHQMDDPTVVLEEYLTDPQTQPDPSKSQSRIMYIFTE